MTRGFLSSTLQLPTEGLVPIRLRAVDAPAATAFAEAVEVAWQSFNRRHLEDEAVRIDLLLTFIAALESPQRYPSFSFLKDPQNDAANLHRILLSKLTAAAIGRDEASRVAPISHFVTDPHGLRTRAINTYVEAELLRWKDFFDTVEAKPLTPE